jgi:glutathione S-transferase
MKLHEAPMAPNPRRVRIFLAEKGLACPERIPVDILGLEQKGEAFSKLNPWRRTPVLELDDGTMLSETVAICRYFEVLHPKPALFGEGALGQAVVEMWNRRVEFGLMTAVAHAYRHIHPRMSKLEVPQMPEWGALNKDKAIEEMRRLDTALQGRAFIAGETISVADISAGIAMDMSVWAKVPIPDDCVNLSRWYEALKARPSWSA